MTNRTLKIIITSLLFSLFLTSCQQKNKLKDKQQNNPAQYKSLDFAQNFAYRKNNGNISIQVHNSWGGAMQTDEYYLLSSSKKLASNADFNEVIHIPVKRVVCMSATQVAQIAEINEEKSIVAVSGADYIYNQSVREQIKAGKTKDVAFGQNLNMEALMNLQPDVVFMYGINTQDIITAQNIRKLGIHVVFNNDYLENTALGRAEWSVFTAAFFNKMVKAEASFLKETSDYQSLIRPTISDKTIFLNIPFKDVWYMPGGKSYFACLLKDAGARYIYAKNEQIQSLSLDFEAVFKAAQNCDLWINAGSMQNLKQIKSIDNRMSYFKAFKNQEVYNPVNRMLPGGANDFWETGVTHPHLLLSDLRKIIDQSTDTSFYFYKRLK